MGYSFKNDIDKTTSRLLFYRLRDVFKNADVNNEQQTLESVQHVLEDATVVDEDCHPNSPFRHRPAYLDDPKYNF